MKKLLSLFLASVMLVSVLTGMQISVSAEEVEYTTMALGSEVLGAEDEDVFTYEIRIDGKLYEAYAYDTMGEEQYFLGIADIPSYDYYEFEVPIGAKYEIRRLPFSKDGYNDLPEQTITGTVDKYTYTESYVLNGELVYNKITKDEYNEKTDNGENEIQSFYYDAINDDIKQADELVINSLYSEGVTEESKVTVAYADGTAVKYPAKLEVSAKFNTRAPSTTFGVTTYYYTGKITLTANEKTYEQEYATVPSADVNDAKSNAITTISPVIRAYAIQALNELKGENQTSLYFADSIEEMLPVAGDLTTDAEESKIVDESTKIIEITNPYQRVDVLYEQEENLLGEYVFFEGTLVEEHEHNFVKGETIDPTCLEDGYTVYICDVANCCETEKRDIVPAGAEYHSFGRAISNNDGVIPTCTEDGKTSSQTSICTICGEKKTTEGTVIKATDHIPSTRAVIENRVEATCTTDGSYDEVIYCTRQNCGAEISRETKVIPKFDHKFGATFITKRATCGSEGKMETTCKRCHYVKETVIPATGNHNIVKTTTKTPTVNRTGTITYTCKNCNFKEKETVPKLFKTSIKSLTAKSEGFRVTWKGSYSVSGYQVQYATNRNFTNARRLTMNDLSTSSRTVKGLNAKTKYYVRVRTYTKVNGKKYYSPWSSYRTVTTKK